MVAHRSCLVVVAFLIAVTPPVAARTLLVAPHHYPTIQAALNVATEGDKVKPFLPNDRP